MTTTTTPALTLAGGGSSYGTPVLTVRDRDCDVDAVFTAFTVSGLPSRRWRLVLVIDSTPAVGKGPAQQIVADTNTAATTVTLTQPVPYVRIKDVEGKVGGALTCRLSLEWLSGTLWVPVAQAQTTVNYTAPPGVQTTIPLGVNIHPFSANAPAEFWQPALDAAQAAGFTWIRLSLPWAYLENGGKGVRDANILAMIDTVMQAIGDRGMKALVIAAGLTPGWASASPNTAWTYTPGSWYGTVGYASKTVSWSATGTYVNGQLPPDNWQDYKDHIEWLIARYAAGGLANNGGTALGAIENMNEPFVGTANIRDAGSGGAMAATPVATLAAWQQNLWQQVQASNTTHGTSVKCIGLVSAYNDWTLLQHLYDTGTFKGNYDALSVHPYPVQFKPAPGHCYDPRLPFGDANTEWHHHPASLGYFLDVMAANGDNAPVWITEFGQATGNTAASDMVVSLAEQADHVPYMWRLLTRYQRVGAVFMHSIEDKGTNYYGDTSTAWTDFGLVEVDHITRKPSFAAVQNVLVAIKAGTA